MANTIYATFLTERDAERAAGAVMDHGVRAASVSFVIPQTNGAPIVAGTPHMPGAAPTPPSVPATYPSPNAPLADIPAPMVATPAPPITAAVDLNSGTRLGQDASIAHDSPGYAYEATSLASNEEILQRRAQDHVPINVPLESAPTVPTTSVPAMAADAPIDVVETDHHAHILDVHRTEPEAAAGITTTTAGDAAKGALGGAGIGLGLGALLGVAALMIPGVGLVAGAGALVAGLAAATGAAGAVAGGVFGFLDDLGLPPNMKHTLETRLQAGEPILSIALTDGVPELEIIAILEKYGATSAQAF